MLCLILDHLAAGGPSWGKLVWWDNGRILLALCGGQVYT